MWFLNYKQFNLFHPESPGVRIYVTRSRLGRLFKPEHFATLTECLNKDANGDLKRTIKTQTNGNS